MRGNKQVDLLALCRIEGLSWYLVAREAQRTDGLTRLLKAEIVERSTDANAARHVLAAALSRLDEHRAIAERAIDDAADAGARLTTVVDDDYPLNLRTIFNLPPFLFYLGRLDPDADARSVAVVGTREASREGKRRAEKMARLLAEEGVTVLSGLAKGIDTEAHRATLEAGGRTVAVVGTGIRKVYPSENRELSEEIARTGAVVSQFWPDSPPATYSFPRRNITMSGMGQGTVVIEASSTSGAKMQARLALEHGRRVFLLRHLVTEQKWAQNYLKRGAIEVRNVRDIVKALRSPAVIRSTTETARQLQAELAFA